MSTVCRDRLPFAALVEYWFGELPRVEAELLEEHLFGCDTCSARMGQVEALAAGIRTVFRNGVTHAVISPAVLAQMKSEGLRLREYRLAPGGSVHCTITAADDFTIVRFAASLAGVQHVDLVRRTEGGPELRLADIPFDATAGEVLYCPSTVALKKQRTQVSHVRLVARDKSSERTLAEYTFNHTLS